VADYSHRAQLRKYQMSRVRDGDVCPDETRGVAWLVPVLALVIREPEKRPWFRKRPAKAFSWSSRTLHRAMASASRSQGDAVFRWDGVFFSVSPARR
jgi:hypothetical protein